MKIALVCHRWDGAGGGLELWAMQLVAGLAARGHEMHVVAFDVRSPSHAATLHSLPARLGKLARGEAVLQALREIAADIVHDTGVGWSYDVLHPQAGSQMANHWRDLRSRSLLARVASRVRPGEVGWRRQVRELEDRQYRQAQGAILIASKVAADGLRDLYGVAEQRIRIVPNAVDTQRFSPSRCSERRRQARRHWGFGEETVFLFSALNPRLKGVYPLLRAMRKLGGCRLLIAGGAPPSHYRRMKNVLFAGYLEDPLQALAAADAFVLPSYHDACSLTVLEAWACGLPAVTSRFNGASELMEDGVHGFRVDDPGDAAGLAEAMGCLVDPLLRRRMAAATRSLALENGFDRHLDRIEAAYRSVG